MLNALVLIKPKLCTRTFQHQIYTYHPSTKFFAFTMTALKYSTIYDDEVHGANSSGAIPKKQLEVWPSNVVEKMDFVFIDAPFPLDNELFHH